MSITMTETTKEKIIFIVVLILLILFALLTGCSWFGGPDVKPNTELETKLKVGLKKVDELDQKFEKIDGDVTVIKTDISSVNTSVKTISKQISEQTNNNESLKSLMVTLALIIAGFFVLFFVLYCVLQWIAPGKTLRNILNPWRNKDNG